MNLRIPSILLTLLALALVGIMVLFFTFPQYLIYYKDSVVLDAPFLRAEGDEARPMLSVSMDHPTPYEGTVAADVQVTAPDYTELQLGSDRGLGYLQGLYVPFKNVTEEGLLSAAKDANRRDVPGLVLQVKNEQGMLAWLSEVDYAAAYSTNSAWNMTAVINELKEDGLYLVAELSCVPDATLAQRNPNVALKSVNGELFTTEKQAGYVDPWNQEVREYIIALCKDLFRMGFDEIILSGVELPPGEVVYTRTISPVLDRTVCVTNFAIAVRQGLEETLKEHDGALNVRMTHDAFTTLTVTNGQTFENMLKVFDRVVIDTETYAEDVQFFLDREADSTLRFVPGMTWSFAGGSWILIA